MIPVTVNSGPLKDTVSIALFPHTTKIIFYQYLCTSKTKKTHTRVKVFGICVPRRGNSPIPISQIY